MVVCNTTNALANCKNSAAFYGRDLFFVRIMCALCISLRTTAKMSCSNAIIFVMMCCMIYFFQLCLWVHIIMLLLVYKICSKDGNHNLVL